MPGAQKDAFRFSPDNRNLLQKALGYDARGVRTIAGLEGCVELYFELKTARDNRAPGRDTSITSVRRVQRSIQTMLDNLDVVLMIWKQRPAFPGTIRDMHAILLEARDRAFTAEGEIAQLHRRRRGTPGYELRDGLAEMVAWALIREEYQLTITSSTKPGAGGIYSRVLMVVLDVTGEPIPTDSTHLVRRIVHRVRNWIARNEQPA